MLEELHNHQYALHPITPPQSDLAVRRNDAHPTTKPRLSDVIEK